MSDYTNLVGGKLKLKGLGSVSKVHKKKKKYKAKKRKTDTDDAMSGGGGGGGGGSGSTEAASQEVEAEREMGTGRITSSGIVVTGSGTKFMQELMAGDGLEIVHPTSFRTEVRVVKMVVSDVSLSVNAPFSSDLISSTQFHCLRLPRTKTSDKDNKRESLKRKKDEEVSAFGTYASNLGATITYRVKKGGAYGGYKIVTQDADKKMSREELLDLRSKKKSDRLCM